MGFAVGMLVRCIKQNAWVNDGDGLPMLGDERGPAPGEICTVRDIEIDRGAWLRFHEYQNPIKWYGEAQFNGRWFRPLDESRLTVFRQMLVTPPSPELVDEDLDARLADCERAVREALGF